MDERSDTELVARARAGSREAFGELIERHYEMATRVAMRLVRGKECARDLVQEAMLQAYLSLADLREESAFTSWLYGIVLNVCRSYIRDQKVEFCSLEGMAGGRWREEYPLADPAPTPEEAAEARELHQRVLAAVDGLSPRIRRATLLFYFEQLSIPEIAAILNISKAAVKGRLYQARKQLRE